MKIEYIEPFVIVSPLLARKHLCDSTTTGGGISFDGDPTIIITPGDGGFGDL